MIQSPEACDAMPLPPGPGRQGQWKRPAVGLILLALSLGVLLFSSFVVVPSAGAAGGCGGG